MSPLKQLKTRQQKMEFLKGLLSGKSAISEIIENQIFLFGWTDMPGMCYLVDSEQLMSYLPVIENSEPILYSKETIDRMKKIPGYFCCIKEFRPGDKGETYRPRLAAALDGTTVRTLYLMHEPWFMFRCFIKSTSHIMAEAQFTCGLLTPDLSLGLYMNHTRALALNSLQEYSEKYL